jgi:NitT/TauT family transport system permease protein
MTLSDSITTVPAQADAPRPPGKVPGRAPSPLRGRLARHGVTLRIASVVILLILWQLLSMVVGGQVLPTPWTTASALIESMGQATFWDDFKVTMLRIVIGFAASMVLGVIVGLIMGLSRIAEGLLDIWVVVGQTIPSLCWVIIAFIMFGLNDTATIVAVTLTSFPIIAVNVWAGVKAIDPKLGQMARTIGAPLGLRTRAVTIPQVLPAVIASARFGFGLVWKVVVLAELLGRTDGIGYRLNYYYQLFRMEQVFALTLFFSIFMVVLELGVFKPIENRLFRWRPEAHK